MGDLSNLSANAFQFKIKPFKLGGGNGSFYGYTIPKGFDDNANATYTAKVAADSSYVVIVGTSKAYPGCTISDTVFRDGSQSTPILSTNWPK